MGKKFCRTTPCPFSWSTSLAAQFENFWTGSAPLMNLSCESTPGKSCSAYPACGPDVERAGGSWVANNETFTDAHIDGNLVTAPAWPAHPQWIAKLLQLLGTKIEP